MNSDSHDEKPHVMSGIASWRPFGVPKRWWLVFAGMAALLTVPYVVWSQTSRVRYLDINSGATKETVEVFGVAVSSSPNLPAVHAVPGLTAEWRWAGMNKAGAVYDGPWGRAAADYRALGNALDEWDVDAATRVQIFGVWRGYLNGNVPGFLNYSYASDDGPPVAARIGNDAGKSLVIFDFRD